MRSFPRSKNWLIVAIHLGVLVGLIWVDTWAQRLVPRRDFSAALLANALAFHYLWVPESALLVVAGVWLTSGGRRARLAYYLVAALSFLIDFVQLAAIVLSQAFISTLALENVVHLRLMVNARAVGALALLTGFVIGFVLLVEKAVRKWPSTKAENLRITAGIAALVAVVSASQLVPSIRVARAQLYAAHMSGETGPVVSLVQVLSQPVLPVHVDVSLRPSQLQIARQLGFELDSNHAPGYPLVKPEMFLGPPPFARRAGSATHPNVLLFFVEGTSARVLGFNQLIKPSVTPNLDQFAADPRVLIVDHYYNHTAATYRGLSGTLCSYYPTFGGVVAWDQVDAPPVHNLCLTDLFEKYGYQTAFWDCHTAGAAHINELARRMGFDRVYNAEEMSSSFLGGQAPLRSDSVSDHQLLRALTAFLDARRVSDAGVPLFLSAYNLGTHANMDPAPDIVPYGDNTNPVLSNLHSYDDAFGIFWRWFLASPYAADTIVIVTADHAHYPEPGMIAAGGDNYQPYFVDQIPLLIYDPTRTFPKHLDARYATSIDFAPTLAQYLGWPSQANPFLGTSLFDAREKIHAGPGLASWDSDYYFIDEHGIQRNPSSGPYARYGRLVPGVLTFIHQLEVTDRLWSPALTQPLFEMPE